MGCGGSKDAGAFESSQFLAKYDPNTEPALESVTVGKNVGLQQLELGPIIGEGAYSRVCHAKLKEGGIPIVLKVLRKHDMLKLKQVAKIASEKKVLGLMRHPLVARLLGTFQDNDRCYIMMPFVNGGELFEYLRGNKVLPEKQVAFYAASLTEGLMYIHSMKVMYRDMKAENILIDAEGNLRIVDFGFAKMVDGKTYTVCGSPEYVAPEIIGQMGYAYSCDWWALGVLTYKMAAGKFPFPLRAKGDTWNAQALSEQLMTAVVYPDSVPAGTVAYLKRLLVSEVPKRMGCSSNVLTTAKELELKKHPYFAANGVDFAKLVQFTHEVPYKPEVKDPNDTSLFKYDPNKDDKIARVTLSGLTVSICDQEEFVDFGPMCEEEG